MRRLLAALLPVAALFAACGPSDFDAGAEPELATDTSAIIGGTLATGDPAVVSLAQVYQGVFYSYCTGTLIAPQTVLTAAHCVDTSITPYAVFGTYVTSPTSYKQVVAQYAHPSFSMQTLNADIAVLKLASPVSGVTPIPHNTTAMSSSNVGLNIRHVGFGVTNASTGSGSGTKRQVTYTIRQVSSTQLESGATGKQTCQGDSGGPGFVVMPGSSQEVVAGVVSYGDQDCAQAGIDTRVDYYAKSFIEPTMAQWEQPTCAEDLRCKVGCTPVDIDCACADDNQCTSACPDLSKDPDCPADCGANGVCSVDACPVKDPDCADEGQSCTSDNQCLWRKCVGDPQHASKYCSRPCTQNSQCPVSGMVCGGGVCVYQQRPTADLGQTCTAETFCLDNGVCAGPSLSDLKCAIPCPTGTCPSTTQTCVNSVTGVAYCAPKTTGGNNNTGGTSGPVFLARAKIDGKNASSCSSTSSQPMWLLAFAALFGLSLRPRRQVAAARAVAVRELTAHGGKLALVLAAAVVGVAGSACGPTEEPEALADAPSEELQRQAREIVGGSTDFGDPEVFMLVMQDSSGQGGVCSGTLISPRTIATAAHCVDPRIMGASSVQIFVMNETQFSHDADWIRVVETRWHNTWDPFGNSLDGDIAMALLERAPSAPKKQWNQSSLTGLQGKPVRVIGYGITGNDKGDSGVKRQVNLTIDQLDGDHLYLGNGVDKGVCHGDSGGPTFHTFSDGVERLVGIHSYDASGDCVYGGDIRIDAYKGWVNQWLTEKEDPYCAQDNLCDGRCADLSLDPDCPADCPKNNVCSTLSCGTGVDLDCVELGDACSSEIVCKNRLCVNDPQHASFYCSQQCATDDQCPTGMECAPGQNICRFPQLPVSNSGESCTFGATFCASGTVCTGPLGGAATCQKLCLNNADCPSSQTCEQGSNNLKYCKAPYVPPLMLTHAKVDHAEQAGGCTAAGGAPLAGIALLSLGRLLRRRRD